MARIRRDAVVEMLVNQKADLHMATGISLPLAMRCPGLTELAIPGTYMCHAGARGWVDGAALCGVVRPSSYATGRCYRLRYLSLASVIATFLLREPTPNATTSDSKNRVAFSKHPNPLNHATDRTVWGADNAVMTLLRTNSLLGVKGETAVNAATDLRSTPLIFAAAQVGWALLVCGEAVLVVGGCLFGDVGWRRRGKVYGGCTGLYGGDARSRKDSSMHARNTDKPVVVGSGQAPDGGAAAATESFRRCGRKAEHDGSDGGGQGRTRNGMSQCSRSVTTRCV
eukprot:1188848-Rhodomonas_salina.2